MTDYKATPEQWAAIEKAQAPVEVAPGAFVAGKDHVLSVIILELRARVEALEDSNWQQEVRWNSKPTPKDRQIRSSLVERVGNRMPLLLDGCVDDASARAAIREVAEWLRKQGTPAAGWALRLEQEAER